MAPNRVPSNIHPPQLTKDYLYNAVKGMDELTIEQESVRGLVVWDDQDAKLLPVNFLEHMTPSDLADMIHVSKDIPLKYRPDEKALAQYLWSVCDKNAFITLNQICILWAEPEDPETFDPSDFIDSESQRLREEFGDDYALEIGAGVLGQLWFERNIAVINMGQIVQAAGEVAQENSDLPDPFFSLENQVLTGLLMTAVHELRHLQMDTNIFLSEDVYPLALSAEEAVESYCRERFESARADDKIIPALYGKGSGKLPLDHRIAIAESKAGDPPGRSHLLHTSQDR